MEALPDDVAAVVEAARALRAAADRVHEVVGRAQAALDAVPYKCEAARRQRDGMALLAGRAHHHGNAMAEAGAVLIGLATGGKVR